MGHTLHARRAGHTAQRRRRGRPARILTAFGAVGALALAACGSDNTGSTAGSTAGTSAGTTAAAGTSASASTSASTAASSGGQVKLVYAGFGGALGDAEAKAYFQPFEQAHPNVKVVYDDGVDFGKLKAMVETNNATWDVYTGDLLAPHPEKYFEKLDCTLVPCDQIIKDSNVTPWVSVYYTYSNVITYDPTKITGQTPSSWADFFDTQKFPGKRAISRDSGAYVGTLMIALLADGVAPNQLFPIDYNRAFKKLDTIKKDIVWFDTNAQCPQLIRDGEATLGNCLTGRVYNAVADGAKLTVNWNQNVSGSGAIAVVKGTKHPKEAQELVAYILDKQNNARLSNYIAYGPTNTLAFGQTNPKAKPFLLSAHADVPNAAYDWPWIRDNGPTVNDKFDQWLQS
jgi:putative spermidine/putrescine transport system substrate-binding protein